MKYQFFWLPVLFCAVLLIGCVDSRPQDTDNLCEIFKEKREWYHAALKAERRWGVPLQIPMAFIYQESRFVADALPPRDYVLGVIPWGRVSSSYGYSQAQKSTWSEYIKETGNRSASRDNFADSIDFISWYIDKSHRLNNVSKWDTYRQYLNYHEGIGGYRQRSYERKGWLKTVAKNVETRASRYGAQYRGCEKQLKKPQGVWEHLFGL